MAGTFLKWLIPGAIAVIGGTALALAQTGTTMTADLTNRTGAALDPVKSGWASVTIDGRDAVIGGTATTTQMIDDVVARVASVHGIRSVTANVALAEFVQPVPVLRRRSRPAR